MPTGPVICIDPSLRTTGGSVFTPNGEMVVADLILNPNKRGRGAAAWASMALAFLAWYGKTPPSVIVLEQQLINYERTPNPDDIVQCNGAGAAILGALLPLNPEVKVAGYDPETWKGSLDKKTFTNRIRERVRESGYKAVDLLDHNALDACGLGLHYFGKMQPRKVIHYD